MPVVPAKAGTHNHRRWLVKRKRHQLNKRDHAVWAPAFAGATRELEFPAKTAMHAALPPPVPRIPPLDSRQRCLARAIWRVRAQYGAGRADPAGATLAAEARRVSPDAVAAGQSHARRPGRHAISRRVVSLLRSEELT